MIINYSSECDCGDYCEYCHPEMCLPEEKKVQMSNDLYDRLFDYISKQRDQVKKELDNKPDLDIKQRQFYSGRLTAFLDILSFLMTDGKLT